MSLNVYPSTSDLPLIAGAQEDLTLVVLEEARRRYKRYGTCDRYFDAGGKVCAVGAVARAAGLTPKMHDERVDLTGASQSGEHFKHALIREQSLELDMIEAAKEAIDLLNEMAVRLYPDAKWSEVTFRTHGQLEVVNEDSRVPFRERKKMVLNCYDQVIEERQGAWVLNCIEERKA